MEVSVFFLFFFHSDCVWCSGLSVLVAVVTTVIVMCLREAGRKDAEEAEKEEQELIDAMASVSDID